MLSKRSQQVMDFMSGSAEADVLRALKRSKENSLLRVTKRLPSRLRRLDRNSGLLEYKDDFSNIGDYGRQRVRAAQHGRYGKKSRSKYGRKQEIRMGQMDRDLSRESLGKISPAVIRRANKKIRGRIDADIDHTLGPMANPSMKPYSTMLEGYKSRYPRLLRAKRTGLWRGRKI